MFIYRYKAVIRRLTSSCLLLDRSQQMSLRDKQLYIMQENNVHWNGAECCPTKREMTEPLGGTNEQGVHVTLYRDGNEKNRQRFYEFSCVEGVENQPCRFMDKKFLNQSRCVQQYSYSYALLKDTAAYDPSNGRAPFYFERKNHTWMLGYIKVRSGCKCIMTPKRTKKSKSKRLMQPVDEGLT